MQMNEDGSVDVYFGPRAPTGNEPNWVPTDPQRGFELMLRVYAPTKEFFDKEIPAKAKDKDKPEPEKEKGKDKP